MTQQFELLSEITFNNYDAPEYLSNEEKNRFIESVVRLREIHTLLAKATNIAKTTSIPKRLTNELSGIIEDFFKLKKELDASKTPKTDYNFNNVVNNITGFHNSFFESRGSNSMMLLINTISNYEFISDLEYRDKLVMLQTQLEEKNSRADEILRKLENPSAERILADYAKEYEKHETSNNEASRSWLITGIVFAAIFITLIVLSIHREWFPATLKLETITNNASSTSEILNIPVLVTKALLISLLIFFIVFSFKQYSIYKHLATINQHKKNAFNSYVLFDAAIGEKDAETRKALLASLAKTIHEAINTGFLSSKLPDQPLIQNVELGK